MVGGSLSFVYFQSRNPKPRQERENEMTTRQIIESEQRLKLQQDFASALRTAAATDSRLNADQLNSYTYGAVLYGQRMCSFNSVNTHMQIYFCRQGELQSRGDYPDLSLRSVPQNGSMCWKDQNGTQYSSEELARYCCERLLERDEQG